ncbi:helix-turn-helix domain-containing protein [Pontibacter ruber]|uniref:Helix-turn-helix domain-containing protein n=1 Tax=Pontibacter ruber TaxID=1343895 RepID=A0ABW5CZ99_9BACT|nr:AraC family transcriptional regulator [Pontibacter ruber]
MEIKECEHLQVLHIKNMVCLRCIVVVRNELQKIGMQVLAIELGRVTVCVPKDISYHTIQAALGRYDFELILDSQSELVEQTKLAILDLIYQDKLSQLNTPVSLYLSEELKKDYATISSTFKDLEEMSLSHYMVLQKVERAKELLEYQELNVSEIASKLGYKSVQHLSAQFKEVTGVTPLRYRKYGKPARQAIQDVKAHPAAEAVTKSSN